MPRGRFVWMPTPPLSGLRTPRPSLRVCLWLCPGVAAVCTLVHPDGGYFVAARGWVCCRTRTRASEQRLWLAAESGRCASGARYGAPHHSCCVPLVCVCPFFFFWHPPYAPSSRFSDPGWPGPGRFLVAPLPPVCFFLSPVPPFSLLCGCFRPWVPWASALCGFPASPLLFVPPFFCPAAFRRFQPLGALGLGPVGLGFFFLPRVRPFVWCVRCALVLFPPPPGGCSWCFAVSPVVLCRASVLCGVFCVARRVVLCLAVWCAVVLCCWFRRWPSPAGAGCAVSVRFVRRPAVPCWFVWCLVALLPPLLLGFPCFFSAWLLLPSCLALVASCRLCPPPPLVCVLRLVLSAVAALCRLSVCRFALWCCCLLCCVSCCGALGCVVAGCCALCGVLLAPLFFFLRHGGPPPKTTQICSPARFLEGQPLFTAKPYRIQA